MSINRSDELGALGATMNQLASMLAQQEQSRRQWVADTSHELRTPVSVLRAQIEAMQDGVRQADPAHLDAMHKQILALTRLINDVYEMARADIGQLNLHQQVVDPWTLVVAACDNFEASLKAAQLKIKMQVSTNKILVNVDADRFAQIIVNLLENSRRYTNAGGCINIDAQQSQSQWLFSIEDTAPAVAPEALAHLGERFFRIDASRTRATGGSGLGLALSRQIAEAMGGTLTFSASNLGGLKVLFSLPIAR